MGKKAGTTKMDMEMRSQTTTKVVNCLLAKGKVMVFYIIYQ